MALTWNGTKGFLKNGIPGVNVVANVADAAKDWVEPRIGLNPNQRGTAGMQNQVSNYQAPGNMTTWGTGAGGQPTANDQSGAYNGSGGAAKSSWTPQDQGSYDQAVAVAQSNLNRIPGQLSTALTNVGNQFNQRNNQLASGLNAAKNQFDTGMVQNQQDDVSNKNSIGQQSASGLRALLRQLGAMGAGGSSAYLYEAPQVVGEVAQNQLSDAGRNYAGNARALDTNFNMFKQDNEEQGRQLNDWRTQQENAARTQSESTKQSLLNKLAELANERAGAIGGNRAAAMQPYIDQISGSQNLIDQLAAFNPTFTGETPVYNAPELSKFMLGANPEIGNVLANQAGGGGRTPYLDLLLGKKKEQEQLV